MATNSKTNTFTNLLDQMRALHDTKNADYAGEVDPLANLRMCEKMGVPAWKGVLVRISDKYSRLVTLSAKDGQGQVADERFEDTLLDLAVYCLLAIELYGERDTRGA